MKREGPPASLHARRMGIDSHSEPVVYLHAASPVARAEGLESHTRVRLSADGRSVIAVLNVVHGPLLAIEDIGLSEAAWQLLQPEEGEHLTLSHPEPLESFSHVRSKIYGHRLDQGQFTEIVRDICEGRYSNVQIAGFLTACADARLDNTEITFLTEAMVAAGRRLHWGEARVADKHCVGGLPGNRTTPIVVAIAAARGLTIPKTSSRAITSPAGTADCMETLTRVRLSLEEMRRVVDREGGCLAWGGSVNLSPADDILIRVERSLDIDSEGQLIASVLSKKVAAGSTDVLIDIPVGPTAKLRSAGDARSLAEQLRFVGDQVGLKLRIVLSDGSQPIGRGIGPALEAHDVLAVLRCEAHAPVLLRDKSLQLAGELLELCEVSEAGAGHEMARETLASGQALEKFEAICRAQGELKTPPRARHRQTIEAEREGTLRGFDNRKLARVAKLAGAPADKVAGLELHARIGDPLAPGQPLLTLHADSPGELAYALDYYRNQPDVVRVE